jgi:hypothetical protein
MTPPGAISFATATPIGVCAALTSDVGGVCVNDSDGGGGGVATIVVVAMAEFEGVVAPEEAVIVTTLPVGTLAGAL